MKTVTYDDTKWKVVPMEPTPKMFEAWCNTALRPNVDAMVNAWNKLLATAPEPDNGD